MAKDETSPAYLEFYAIIPKKELPRFDDSVINDRGVRNYVKP